MNRQMIKGSLMMTVLVLSFQNCAKDTSNEQQTSQNSSSASAQAAAQTQLETVFKGELNRVPSKDELVKYLDDIKQGRSLLDILNEIMGSTEAKLRKLYLTYLQREPDAEGLAAWLSAYAQGAKWEDIVMTFRTVAECKVDCLDPDLLARLKAYEDQIKALYRSVLNRDVDPEGLATFLNQMKLGKSADEIKALLENSPEGTVRRFYLAYLLREPEPEGLNGWVKAIHAGMSYEKAREGFRRADECKVDCIR